MGEVLGAVQSLYMDMLKPVGRILRKRLAERALAAGRCAQDIDMESLRLTCMACPLLRVESRGGGDWAVVFTCCPETFVNIYSPEDVYPAQLWQSAAFYFESLDDDAMVLPGSRYSCAQELMARRPPFLSGYSLGQVSHVVQLAISHKKLLGYLSGALVPYSRSGSKVKDQCAARRQRCAAAPPLPGGPPVEWEQLRGRMKELMGRVPIGGSMPLSNVKRLFRARFQMELSETALGHSKLSELLNDPRLRDTCLAKLQGHGYVVTHPRRRAPPSLSPGSSLVPAPAPPARENSEPRRYRIRNTFIHVDDESSAETPSNRGKAAPRHSRTLPVAFGCDFDSEDDDEGDDMWDGSSQDCLLAAAGSTASSENCPASGRRAGTGGEGSQPEGGGDEVFAVATSPQLGMKLLGLTPRPFVVQNTFVNVASEPETPWASVVRKAKTTTHASLAADNFGFGI